MSSRFMKTSRVGGPAIFATKVETPRTSSVGRRISMINEEQGRAGEASNEATKYEVPNGRSEMKDEQRSNEVRSETRSNEVLSEAQEQPNEVEDLGKKLRNVKFVSDEAEEPPKRRARIVRRNEEDDGEYEVHYENGSNGHVNGNGSEKKPRKESMWLMFQKEMRQTPEVQALPGKDRLGYITLKWKEYKENTPKAEQEDHMIKFKAKQLVNTKLKKMKAEREMQKYEDYLHSIAAQIEAEDDEEVGKSVFKISKKA